VGGFVSILDDELACLDPEPTWNMGSLNLVHNKRSNIKMPWLDEWKDV
jgi:hypothetical protein